jgi:hypothetical protein
MRPNDSVCLHNTVFHKLLFSSINQTVALLLSFFIK